MKGEKTHQDEEEGLRVMKAADLVEEPLPTQEPERSREAARRAQAVAKLLSEPAGSSKGYY
jgi:hypothetical protein